VAFGPLLRNKLIDWLIPTLALNTDFSLLLHLQHAVAFRNRKQTYIRWRQTLSMQVIFYLLNADRGQGRWNCRSGQWRSGFHGVELSVTVMHLVTTAAWCLLDDREKCRHGILLLLLASSLPELHARTRDWPRVAHPRRRVRITGRQSVPRSSCQVCHPLGVMGWVRIIIIIMF